MKHSPDALYRTAYRLALFTIAYNLVEGIVSVLLGYQEEAFTLFGFGVDSFVEMISAAGIAVMVRRLQRHGANPTRVEVRALQITAWGFIGLALGLSVSSVWALMQGHTPQTSAAGVVISLISMAVMGWLIYRKTQLGKALNSAPMLADAECARVCLYMGATLLVASGLYWSTGFIYADSLGMAGIILFSLREAKESFERARALQYPSPQVS